MMSDQNDQDEIRRRESRMTATTNGKLVAIGAIIASTGLIATVIFTTAQNMDTKLKSTTELLVQRIESLERQIVNANLGSRERRAAVGKELDNHKNETGHPLAMNSITAIEQKLLEVETQFKHHSQLISLLWQRTYTEPLPNPPAAR